MDLSYADLDTDITTVEGCLVYLLDVYYNQNSSNVTKFLDSAGQVITLPLIFRNQGIINSNGVICDEFFVRIPYLPVTSGGASVPASDYRWRYATHVENSLYRPDATPAPFPTGWKTVNLVHNP
jgi:hypothetical protein